MTKEELETAASEYADKAESFETVKLLIDASSLHKGVDEKRDGISDISKELLA